MARSPLRSALRLFLFGTVAALAVRLFIVENYRIISDSMLPALWSGDIVLASKFDFSLRLPFSAYELVRLRPPVPGEVVVFSLPEKGAETYVKRVVAVAGDRVEVKDGGLHINDKPAGYLPIENSEPLRIFEQLGTLRPYPIYWTREKAADFGPVDVPPSHFFVLGDNRDRSIDSRVWGPLPSSCLKGKVRWVLLSLSSVSPGSFRSL